MEHARVKHKTTVFLLSILLSSLFLAAPLPAQNSQSPAIPAQTGVPTPNYSGMYAFRRDGEFVQINVEDDGRLTGFVSRYGDLESDRGVFLDQFFTNQSKLEGNKINFTTAVVHGVYFDFKGTLERGDGKNPNDEAYYVLRGTLTEFTSGTDGKPSSKKQDVAFKSFPRDLTPPQ